jgi:hypothetical protein
MPGNGELIRCRQRKAALLEQSAACRQRLAAQLQPLRPVTEWMDVGLTIGRNVRDLWSGMAPWILGGLGRLDRTQGTAGRVLKLASALAIGRALAVFWKRHARQQRVDDKRNG